MEPFPTTQIFMTLLAPASFHLHCTPYIFFKKHLKFRICFVLKRYKVYFYYYVIQTGLTWRTKKSDNIIFLIQNHQFFTLNFLALGLILVF